MCAEPRQPNMHSSSIWHGPVGLGIAKVVPVLIDDSRRLHWAGPSSVVDLGWEMSPIEVSSTSRRGAASPIGVASKLGAAGWQPALDTEPARGVEPARADRKRGRRPPEAGIARAGWRGQPARAE